MGRLLEALRAEVEGAANPAKAANLSSSSAQDSQIRGISRTNRLEPTRTHATRGMVDTAAIRACLLRIIHAKGGDPRIIHQLSESDLAGYADMARDLLSGFVSLMIDAADRLAERVPPEDNAAVLCAHCGPVWLHPSIAVVLPTVGGWPTAAGCSWCFVRKAGGHVPRPRVTCETCEHFQCDPVNPAGGAGCCARDHTPHYPMQRHRCEDFQPSGNALIRRDPHPGR
jgi:hypothetical protein